VLLFWVSSVRNLLIDDCLIVLISLDNCWLALFRTFLSCGFLDWSNFLLRLRFSAIRFPISFGKLRPFSFVLITGVLFHAASWMAVVKAFSSLSSWSAVLSGTDRLILLSSKWLKKSQSVIYGTAGCLRQSKPRPLLDQAPIRAGLNIVCQDTEQASIQACCVKDVFSWCLIDLWLTRTWQWRRLIFLMH
jgi:hypothetical protein